MEYTYTSHYKTIETFKETNKQAIYVGIELLNNGAPVVINHIKDHQMVELLKEEQFKNVLNNLVYVEAMENELILITKVLEETEPLLVYLEDNYVPMESRMNMALQYLKGIVNYDELKGFTKSILIDEVQLVVLNGQMVFDELMVMDEAKEVEEWEFNALCSKISSVLEKIIYFDYKHLKKEEFFLAEVQHFLDDLNNNQKFNNFNEVMEEFRKLYIYHVCMESIEDPDDEKPSANLKPSKIIPIVACIALLLGLGAYGLLNYPINISLPSFIQKSERVPVPKAYFTVEKNDNYWEFINQSTVEGDDNTIEEILWEIEKDGTIIKTADSKDLTLNFTEAGEYTISVKVKDSFNQWSEKYIQSITVEITNEEDDDVTEVEDPSEDSKLYRITYGEGIVEDHSNNRKDQPAHKIERLQEENPELRIEIEKDKNNYDTLTFWIKAMEIGAIDITIDGYRQGTPVFKKNVTHTVKVPERWELVNVPLSKSELSELVLSFPSLEYAIWISDIKLDSFK